MVLSALAAIFQSLVLFLDTQGRSTKHHQAGVSLNGINRALRLMLNVDFCSDSVSEAEALERLRRIGHEVHQINTDAPILASHIMERVNRQLDSRPKRQWIVDIPGDRSSEPQS